jgi:phage terminase small subunit
LLRNEKVATAVARLLERAASNAEATITRCITELAKVAFGDIRNVVTWDENGVYVRASSELTPDQAALVAEVEERVYSRGADRPVKVIRVRFNDRLAALRELLRVLEPTLEKREGVKVYVVGATSSASPGARMPPPSKQACRPSHERDR